MRRTLIPRGRNNKIRLQNLLVIYKALSKNILKTLHAQLDVAIRERLDAGYLAATEDAVRPGALVDAEFAALVVHALVEGFDELEADDAVICGAGFGEEGVAGVCGAGAEVIDIVGIKDRVDTALISLML